MWFGIVFAVMVEIVPLNMRSTTVGVFLFVMNNIGGNLPILVEPTRQVIGFRESLYIYYAGFYGISSIMFFLTMFLMEGGTSNNINDKPIESGATASANIASNIEIINKTNGLAGLAHNPAVYAHDNKMFIDDSGKVSLELPPRVSSRFNNYNSSDNSRL